MATYHEIPKPPRFHGSEEEKWRQLHAYLIKVSEHLENIINNMTKEADSHGTDRNV